MELILLIDHGEKGSIKIFEQSYAPIIISLPQLSNHIDLIKNKIKLGIIGLGTVGGGVFKSLKEFKNIEIVKIAVHNKNKKRNIDGLDESIITDNAYEVVNDPQIQIVAELIGGTDPAFDLIKTAIANGKHIVTANKELLAKHGEELFKFAQENNKVIHTSWFLIFFFRCFRLWLGFWFCL